METNRNCGLNGGRRSSEELRAALTASQTVSYERKSTKRKDGTTKSIEDQQEANRETAQEYGLTLLPENQLSEEVGHGGDEFWLGGGGTGLAGEQRTGVRYRPVLTKLLEGICEGRIKCVICWSIDRLARDVSLMKQLIDKMGEFECILLDRNGPLDIISPEGRGAALQIAITAQTYRELCSVNSPRGTRSTRNKGRTVVTGNVFGFRHVGKGKVISIPEELERVKLIFQMFCSGMSLTAIARHFMDQGIALAPDLYEIRSIKRTEHTEHIIYNKQIRTILTDCRYQGRQPHEGQQWDCKDFLVDGQPAIAPALFEEAQRVLAGRKPVANAAKEDNCLAGLMKCGFCGQYLCLNPCRQKDGTIKRYWYAKTSDPQCWCIHSVPNITQKATLDYIASNLSPWLIAQLEEMEVAAGGSEAANGIVRLRQEIDKKEAEFKVRIRQLYAEAEATGKDTSKAHLTLQELHEEALLTMKTQVANLEADASRSQELLGLGDRVRDSLERWQSLSDAQKAVVLRSVLRWIILLPSEDFSDRPKRKGGSRSTSRKIEGAPAAGRMIFCTAFGLLHTAVIKRVTDPESRTWHRSLGLVPAGIEDCLGSCAELPDPAAFAAGLARSYAGRGYPFPPSAVMPGYLAGSEPPAYDVD